MSVRDDYPAVAILHDAWTARDRTGQTPPQAVQMLNEIERLRSYCDAWMNGVADVVEQFGYDRRAASGPADLLPGLTTLVDQRNDLWERVCELETRLERHPVTTGGLDVTENRFARTLYMSRVHDGDPYEDGEREYLLDCDVAVANIARILEVSTGREVDGDGDPWSIVCSALVDYASVIDEARERFPDLDAWLASEHAWEPLAERDLVDGGAQ